MAVERRPASRDALTPEPAIGLGRLLSFLARRIDVSSLDRLWIFPPFQQGRREWGLVVLTLTGALPAQRTLLTARYRLERTGTGLQFDPEITVEGAAPPERIPRIVEGVVRRSEVRLGEPDEIVVEGDRVRFESLVEEFGGRRVEGEFGRAWSES